MFLRATAQLGLTGQKTLYVEISRARGRAEFVTGDWTALRERLEAATGEQISALKGIGAMERETSRKAAEVERADGLVLFLAFPRGIPKGMQEQQHCANDAA